MKKQKVIFASAFWLALVTLLTVCAYFMVHNAAWLFGDEAIVYSTTGMGKAFSPLGFDCMIECYGRFYPFAYNLYNVLLLFDSGQISAEAHYLLQSIALGILAICFALTALHILKDYSVLWKYSIAFCFVAITVFRVLPEFITCYTGAWIIFMLLAIFILCTCKFEDTEYWGWGIPAVISVTYMCYCYENMCVIPLAYGVCSLLFNYKNLSNRKRWFNVIISASALLFLLLYLVIVLPEAKNFYSHYTDNSLLINAFKMFIAHKIYWIALVFLFVRLWDIIKNKKSYIFADSLLLTAFAYFCGTALLQLDFVYYYNFGALIALTAILCYCKAYLKPYWVFTIMIVLCVFYGRKTPSLIMRNQESRINSAIQIEQLSEYMQEGYSLYWYAPEYHNPAEFLIDLRNWCCNSLITYLEWFNQEDIEISEQSIFDEELKGIWINPEQNNVLFPQSDTIFTRYEVVYMAGNAVGYCVK